MTDKHEVTVYDRVPARASVSVGQIEAYLRRTGWSIRWSDEIRGLSHWHKDGDRVWTRRDDSMGGAIETIAQQEHRQPSAVLADIASEPV